MIRHVVLFTWSREASADERQKVAYELRAIAPQMKGLRAYHVGHDAGIVSGNADFAVVADFEDAASFLAYRDHPAHREVIEEFIMPIAKQRVAVQYEI
jgi:heme-degrading monooxygenase HmoA